MVYLYIIRTCHIDPYSVASLVQPFHIAGDAEIARFHFSYCSPLSRYADAYGRLAAAKDCQAVIF